MADFTRPDIAEHYATAVDSSHLEVTPDRRGDVDYIVAAGWVREGLGTSLYRLRVEWDGVHAEYRNAQEAERKARLDSAAAAREGARLRSKGLAAEAGACCQRAAELDRRADRSSSTERVLLMTRLKGLRPAREAVNNYAHRLAPRSWICPADFLVEKIAGRALELWLNDNCPACDGRGFSGGFGVPMILCHDCGGTGRRQNVTLHHSQQGQAFGRQLLASLDRKADYVTSQMRRFLAHRRAPDASAAALATIELGAQLQRLRSAAAQED